MADVKKGRWVVLVLAWAVVGCSQGGRRGAVLPADSPRIVQNFDEGWGFVKGDVVGMKEGKGAGMRVVDLPHDWAIEGPYDAKAATDRGGGYLPSGVGWYEKTFEVPAGMVGKRIFVDFDGVMAHSEVFLNGVSLGKRAYGYVAFEYELSGHLRAGQNVLAVRVDDTKQPASRWYAGAGIYRHVQLVATGPVHVEHWGTFVTTPEVTAERARVHVKTSVVNDELATETVSAQVVIWGPDGKVAGGRELGRAEVAGKASGSFATDVVVERPALWDMESPHMYRAVVTVRENGRVVDEGTTAFGIRSIEFRADRGFWINGRNVKLLGAAIHSEGGAVGAAVPLGVWERRLRALKELGVNAIRTAHNPPAAEVLDLCDRLGMLVMDESFDTWTAAKPHAPEGYNTLFKEWWKQDLTSFVLRDRNHPSIVIWSTGNEIRDNLASEAGRERFVAMSDLVHQLDGTRPVTFALFRPNGQHLYDNGFAELMDVVGQNYAEGDLVKAHLDKPGRKVIGTENRQDLKTWLVLRDNAFMSGQFLWVGVDYLGESDWPAVGSTNGLIDRTGLVHPRGVQRESWWRSEAEHPMVGVFRVEGAVRGAGRAPTEEAVAAGAPPTGVRGPELLDDWSPRGGQAGAMQHVEVYSNCATVELSLNGVSLGSKEKPADDSARDWEVPYAAGELRAVGKGRDGRKEAEAVLRTAGAAVQMKVESDAKVLQPGFDDVAFVRVSAVDQAGTLNPGASSEVTFSIEGPGELVATDNGDRENHVIYSSPVRALYRGRAMAIVRATGAGKIRVKVSSSTLGEETVTITGK